MHVKNIFEKVYKLMDQSVIEGNCGDLCDEHCCRPIDGQGDEMGMYLLPYEYKYIQMKKGLQGVKHEIHTSDVYELPEGVDALDYICCNEDQCNRVLRPIQCRTYPFEPHIIDGDLHLVIEREQIHTCPLLMMKEKWRREFIMGIYEGWTLLLSIPRIKMVIAGESKRRTMDKNILESYDYKTLLSMVDA